MSFCLTYTVRFHLLCRVNKNFTMMSRTLKALVHHIQNYFSVFLIFIGLPSNPQFWYIYITYYQIYTYPISSKFKIYLCCNPIRATTNKLSISFISSPFLSIKTQNKISIFIICLHRRQIFSLFHSYFL